MKIVMLVLNNFTHDARVHKEAKTLAAAGHEVTVLAYQDGAAPDSEHLEGFQVKRIALRTDTWRVIGLRQFLRYFEFTFRAAHVAMKLNPDVCHAHAIQALPACWLASRLQRCHLIYDAHEFEQGRDFINAKNVPSLMRRAWSLPETLFIRKAHVITVSDSLAEALAETYHIPKPLVVRNCPESAPQALNSNWLRMNYNIPETSVIVLYQGKLHKGRGLENLVQSVKFLRGITLVIVGDGPLNDALQLMAKNLPHSTQVIFVGHVPLEELPMVTASANMGVILTQNTCLNHYYSLPNKLFEYMQAGIPVIGSNLPEIAHIIENHGIGRIVDVENPQAIAAGIQHLVNNPHDCQKMKLSTTQSAKIYNWYNEGAKLLALYESFKKYPLTMA